MRTRTTTALIAAGLLATLTACGGDTDAKPAPPSTTAAASPTPTLSAQACADALYEVDGAARKAGTDPADRVMPDLCVGLTADEYQDAILDATVRLNQDARDELQDQSDEAAEQDQ
ncbi:hypothetical protein ABZ371_00795 [Streptomyces sp. NPDC005899]|uniref:hypothetical protein n=1 Tax=Streptomyces sp. NPDC005899 TaxID=3155716 RepID=UPI0033CC8A23